MREENQSLDNSKSDDRKKKRNGKHGRYYNNKRNKRDFPVCPLCGNSVKDINTAIAAENSEEPAHFDCVIKHIEESEELEKDEKVCYLGRGSFGIVKTRSNGSMKFFIRKRIQYEKEEKSFDWRKTISNKIKK